MISGRLFNIAIRSLVTHEQCRSESISNREREGDHASDNRCAVERPDAEMIPKFGVEAIKKLIAASAWAKDLSLPHGSNLPTPSVISR
jgi:hypothetical protein